MSHSWNDISANDLISSSSDVKNYYSKKTSDILHKYGPGPRVHFHVGYFSTNESTDTTVPLQIIQQRLVTSQEALITHCARAWIGRSLRAAELLDIGCGLGGGAIYWAQEHGANVTALTNMAEHVPIISDFAKQADEQRRIKTLLTDVHDFIPQQKYDAAVAIESSGYMDRVKLFQIVGRSLKSNGWFGIVEHFLCRHEWAGFIDKYYKTHLGTITEYIDAAHAAGFELDQNEDLTDRVSEFWMQSMAWSSMKLDSYSEHLQPMVIERARLIESVIAHGKLFRIWRDHAVETRMLRFRLR
ncbi:methyltransferase domain-containing protein [Trinickia violacea]|uniref:Methyltransferase domain-containing protein n=1 Tax=Trinickia violacea TaxID=2571746 RepID=A0A4P8J014_9BURK|nr:class I SAM-dependent methyltransferase [Trinickia violacea]QCP55038.1 methyltransferase domain-containing protein [Trinickia violacea]